MGRNSENLDMMTTSANLYKHESISNLHHNHNLYKWTIKSDSACLFLGHVRSKWMGQNWSCQKMKNRTHLWSHQLHPSPEFSKHFLQNRWVSLTTPTLKKLKLDLLHTSGKDLRGSIAATSFGPATSSWRNTGAWCTVPVLARAAHRAPRPASIMKTLEWKYSEDANGSTHNLEGLTWASMKEWLVAVTITLSTTHTYET